ncbi:MAG: hypothetical protein PHE58_00445 [Candidatus Omnitrophica bacterium]|nr:hypothetical protein [Candidatus Omnitrophota bacterium]
MFNPNARWDRSLPDSVEEKSYPVEVFVRFSKGSLIPVCFSLNENKYTVKSINYSWSERRGRSMIYFFSVSDGSDTYQLCFNSETFAWRMFSHE